MATIAQQAIRRSRAAVGLTPPAELPSVLVFQTITYAIGSGFYTGGSAIFFFIYAGLSPTQLAAGSSIVGMACLAAQVPIGIVVDRIGGRRAWVFGAVGQAVSFGSYLLVSNFAIFLLVAICTGLSAQLGNLGRGRFLGELLAPAARITASAYLRSILNLGLALGTGASTLLVALDSRTAIAAVVVVNSLSFVFDAILLCVRFIPGAAAVSAVRVEGPQARRAISDWPFLAVSLVNGILRTGDILLTLILPVWLVRMTDGPHVLVPVALLMNMVIVVTCQTRASKGCDDVAIAARRQCLAGFAISAGCILFFLDWYVRGPAVWLMVSGATVCVTLGETLVMASAWGLSYGLSTAERRGEYLAVFGSGFQAAATIAPMAFTGLLVAWTPSGWLVLGAFFAIVAVVSIRVTAFATQSRAARTESR
ncbi:MFS transporter [Nocardia abscessus]|uniref:MFS transporter n=1 Tax=Nocardia abscessus TaxID=120957 RepID=UPI0024572985|nr:MFS transporter [Nocardia abscessus]